MSRESLRIALALVSLSCAACTTDAAVLVLRGGNGDGSLADGNVLDGDVDADGAVIDGGLDASDGATAMDGDVDASVPVSVEIHASGFDAYAGMTVYGRLGPLSTTVVSTVVGADGTFVFVFPPVITVLNNIYLDTYVDVNANANCERPPDQAGGKLVNLDMVGPASYRADITLAELSPPLLFGCNGL